MPTYNPIYTRSPYIVQESSVSEDDVVTFELYLWNDPSSAPASPTYTEEKIVNSSNIDNVNFNVSPYCEEFITHQRFTPNIEDEAATVTEYARVKLVRKLNDVTQATTYYIAFSGYGYYTEGYNPDLGDVLLDEGTYYYHDVGDYGSLTLHDNQVGATWEVKYTSLDSGASTSTEIVSDEVAVFPYVFNLPAFINNGNKVEVLKDSIVQKTYYFLPICEPKYTPVVCDFVNRYGAWQRIVFFKASKQNYNIDNTEYNLMSEGIDYDIYENRRQTFNMNATKTIKVNTGFVPESYKDVMRQLLLSKKILLDDVPVKPKTKSIELQEHINMKLVNYELEFDYSHNERNYIV